MGSENSSNSQPMPFRKTKVVRNHIISVDGQMVVSTNLARRVVNAYSCGLILFQPGSNFLRTGSKWMARIAAGASAVGSIREVFGLKTSSSEIILMQP